VVDRNRAHEQNVIRSVIFILTLVLLPQAEAHHAFAAAYEEDKRGVIEGVIVETFFRNPHIQYYLQVTMEDGSKKTWAAASMTPNMLRGMGWTKTSFNNGDTVTIEGYLGRDSKPKIWIKHIEKDDGTVFDMGN
jgi:Family of unknown function (DUF6152)